MIPEFYGKITGGIFLFNKQKVFQAYTKGLLDGDYYATLHKVKKMKSNEQLGYFHAVVVPTILKQMIEDGNRTVKFELNGKVKEIPLTEDMVVAMMKEVWAKSKGVKVKSKADMVKVEASELIEISIEWAARYLGCSIPEPSKL